MRSLLALLLLCGCSASLPGVTPPVAGAANKHRRSPFCYWPHRVDARRCYRILEGGGR